MANITLNMDSLKTRRDWRRHKVKDGHNVFRILPPFGDSSNGYPYRKWQIIWGLSDPESGRSRPFASSMTSEKKCPVTEYVVALKKKSELIKAKMQSSGSSDEEIKERLLTLNKLISDLSPKTIYVYNAADKSGDVGLLELKSTAHKQMKDEMVNYINDYQQDPTSLNSEELDSGVWFDVHRTGEGRDTSYSVKRVQAKIKGQSGKITFEDDRSPLPDSVVENYSNMGYDLSSIYQVKTYDELQAILDANMPNLIDICADADMSVDVDTAVSTPVKATSKPNMAKGSKPLNVRLDDEDDEVETVAPVKKTATKKVSTSIDDDFLAEADALLNS